MRQLTGIVPGLVLSLVLGLERSAPAEDCSQQSYSSTYELIQKTIFENERHGCTNELCHSSDAAAGGLDLSHDAAYGNLVDVRATSVDGKTRVFAGEKTRSLLFVNLAAKTFPDDYAAPVRAMPLDPFQPLTSDEIELMRLWIEAGAPKEGVVRGTETFDACLPPFEPVPIKPLPTPEPGTGVQVKMPRWTLPPKSETETCFASWYDVTDQVPEEYRTPDGAHFRFKESSVRQDNLSHHLIVYLYEGVAGPADPVWGEYVCHGGSKDGQSCSPLNITECGTDSVCGTNPQKSIACIGFGPGDGSVGLQAAPFSGIQKAADTVEYAPGVYREMPLKGLLLWNSHAFNPSTESGKMEAWLNFMFAAPDEQKAPVTQIFNAEELFKMNAPAFGTDEPCHIETLPGNAHVFELSSHMHKRGKRWRTFEGAFRCDSGRNKGEPCSPVGYDMASNDPCDGASCVSVIQKRVGDCNSDGGVTVDEIVTSVNLALGKGRYRDCSEADTDGSRSITVDEVITAVTAALQGVPPPTQRNAEDSLLYVSGIYNDPVTLRFNPPLTMPGKAAPADERSLTFCALYDNGFTDPAEVKRASTSPEPPLDFPGVGGPCAQDQQVCAEGKVREACNGRSQAARDASCDSTEGSGDGRCDACPLHGGVTTEDEMFLLLGQYYVPEQ